LFLPNVTWGIIKKLNTKIFVGRYEMRKLLGAFQGVEVTHYLAGGTP
jgi:hypothetical protein